MNKQNFLTFKEDFKKSIEFVRLSKKHRKMWHNDGFESKEAQDEAIKKRNLKEHEISESMLFPKNCYSAELKEFHMAYYIAKHRIDNDNERKEYVLSILNDTKYIGYYGCYYQPFKKFTEQQQNTILHYTIEQVNKYLKEYGDDSDR